jgi:hypothetical protein
MNELKFQAECYKAFNANFPNYRNNIYRIKNELDNHGKHSAQSKMIQLSENKATGVRKGISDFCVIDAIGNSHWIELKLPNGIQSEEQKAFSSIVKNYYLVYSVDEFMQVCNKIFNL